jgi:hypothetical protein
VLLFWQDDIDLRQLGQNWPAVNLVEGVQQKVRSKNDKAEPIGDLSHRGRTHLSRKRQRRDAAQPRSGRHHRGECDVEHN